MPNHARPERTPIAVGYVRLGQTCQQSSEDGRRFLLLASLADELLLRHKPILLIMAMRTAASQKLLIGSPRNGFGRNSR